MAEADVTVAIFKRRIDLFISMFGNVPSVFQIVPSLLNDF